MKAKVIAVVKNSPVIPLDSFVAQLVIEFPDDENVFGRVLTARRQFKERYGEEIDLTIRKVEYL